MHPPNQAKLALRRQMQHTLHALDTRHAEKLSARIVEHTLEHPALDQAIVDGRPVVLFAPLKPAAPGRPPRNEANLSGIAEHLLAVGAPVAAYRLTGPRQMDIARIARWPDDLEYGPTGIPSVQAHCPAVPLADIAGAVLLIPGLAFDAQGGRLGRGAAYFDRFLAPLRALHPAPTTIGIAFACQIVPAVPLEAWDIPMDAVITEDGPLN